MPRNPTSGAKVQISLTLSLAHLVKIQQIVERDKISLSLVCQRLVEEGLDRLDSKPKR